VQCASISQTTILGDGNSTLQKASPAGAHRDDDRSDVSFSELAS